MSIDRFYAATLALGIAAVAHPATAQSIIPDAENLCPLEASTFNSWFASGAPSKNGVVKVADSVAFPANNTDCTFFAWGAQMFLWLTSPQPGGGTVLNSPNFFVVSPEADKTRTLTQSSPDKPLPFAVRSEKSDLAQAASGAVLMSQGGSLVYYGIHTNDVYAYFLTGQKTGALTGFADFPYSSDDLSEIEAYVAKTFPDVDLTDPNALTIEMKSSWVEVSSLPADIQDQFITVQAEVPNYTGCQGQQTCTPDPATPIVEKTLAMLGVHIVGTVQNHPEFVWATFEHKLNAPNDTYNYLDASGKQTQTADPTDVAYLLFAANGTPADLDKACMVLGSDGTTIKAQSSCPNGIASSNVTRRVPWGFYTGNSDTKPVTTITEILSMNTNVLSLASAAGMGDDVRLNYHQVGSTWTAPATTDGVAPIPGQSGFQFTSLRGMYSLANSTMETYTQASSAFDPTNPSNKYANNCFGCHQGESFGAGQLSHIYSEIQALSTP